MCLIKGRERGHHRPGKESRNSQTPEENPTSALSPNTARLLPKRGSFCASWVYLPSRTPHSVSPRKRERLLSTDRTSLHDSQTKYTIFASKPELEPKKGDVVDASAVLAAGSVESLGDGVGCECGEYGCRAGRGLVRRIKNASFAVSPVPCFMFFVFVSRSCLSFVSSASPLSLLLLPPRRLER